MVHFCVSQAANTPVVKDKETIKAGSLKNAALDKNAKKRTLEREVSMPQCGING